MLLNSRMLHTVFAGRKMSCVFAIDTAVMRYKVILDDFANFVRAFSNRNNLRIFRTLLIYYVKVCISSKRILYKYTVYAKILYIYKKNTIFNLIFFLNILIYKKVAMMETYYLSTF